MPIRDFGAWDVPETRPEMEQLGPKWVSLRGFGAKLGPIGMALRAEARHHTPKPPRSRKCDVVQDRHFEERELARLPGGTPGPASPRYSKSQTMLSATPVPRETPEHTSKSLEKRPSERLFSEFRAPATEFGRSLATVGQVWPDTSQMWPKLATVGPILANAGLMSAAFGGRRATIIQIMLPGVLFEQVWEHVRGVCLETGAMESMLTKCMRNKVLFSLCASFQFHREISEEYPLTKCLSISSPPPAPCLGVIFERIIGLQLAIHVRPTTSGSWWGGSEHRLRGGSSAIRLSYGASSKKLAPIRPDRRALIASSLGVATVDPNGALDEPCFTWPVESWRGRPSNKERTIPEARAITFPFAHVGARKHTLP